MIYIVEDDREIREMIGYALKNSGFEVAGLADGNQLDAAVEVQVPEMILLDIMLPEEDGLAVLRRLREDERTKDVPIMMVTAKTTELDKVKGLDMGADDYLTKPFGIMELVSRVKALLRRSAPRDDEEIIVYAGIMLDVRRHLVSADGRQLELTYKEYELLKYLLKNSGIVLSREKIMDKVWGYDFEGESRTVDMHIKTLRQKLGQNGAHIKTIRNVGYKLGD
jgi:two-component system alkaline phosphatase synthesis response regulator PhoP